MSRALLLASMVLTGCGRTPESQSWFPLEAGHRWTYTVTTRSGADTSERESLTLRTLGSATLVLDDQPAWQRRSDSGVNYWLRADASGIVRVASKSDMQADPVADAPGRFVLKAPFVVGTQWQAPTTAYLLMRTAEYPREIKHSHPNIPMTYEIEAVSDVVRTPAGSFSPCLRVRGSATVKIFVDAITGYRDQPLTTLEWYCRGVGLVKLERSEPSTSPMLVGGSRTLELESWQ
ncbi:hypothetical protein [Pelomonas sp. Root1237]|uniref:hypothetical protein n=1 Tax=Pelomonas sp. Root1237 TaxID=1736434 RepID=UPI0006F50CA0|nr:hypothetical protein [Pelomonas sp. Root1237]KQV88169.1 hypothetical protein ASC91_15200 [Pelomonas sp. Root1237]